MAVRLLIACDHGGFELKQYLKEALAGIDVTLTDLGVQSSEPVDYTDKAHELAAEILSGRADMGILVCGTGIGMSMAANRHDGIRAALCTDPYMARMSREHNNANVLCLGGRVTGPALAEEIVHAFMGGRFQGGRHQRRLEKITPR